MTTEFKMVPVEPTAEMLAELAAEVYPDDNNAGKALQRLRGCDVVFPKYEVEAAVGKYQRMLAAAPASPQAAQAVGLRDGELIIMANKAAPHQNRDNDMFYIAMGRLVEAHYTHADAGEVERWKQSAEDATQVQIKLTAEVKYLRAQLAEMHAIKEVPGENALWDVLNAAVGVITRRAYPHALESEAHNAGAKVILDRRAGLYATAALSTTAKQPIPNYHREPLGMNDQVRRRLTLIAREAAISCTNRYSYMPTTPEAALLWQPHAWVLRAMRMVELSTTAKPETDHEPR